MPWGLPEHRVNENHPPEKLRMAACKCTLNNMRVPACYVDAVYNLVAPAIAHVQEWWLLLLFFAFFPPSHTNPLLEHRCSRSARFGRAPWSFSWYGLATTPCAVCHYVQENNCRDDTTCCYVFCYNQMTKK